MKIFKRFLMGLGTVLLLALSLQLVAPKAVRAVVSTLVTVANTTANPVPIDADADVRNTVVLYAELFSGFTIDQQLNTQFSDLLTNAPYSVPSGKRLVIDDVSADVLSTSGTPLFRLLVGLTPTVNNGDGSFTEGLSYPVYIPLTQNFENTQYIAHEKTRLVVGPGATIASSEIGQITGANVVIIGHLVDCSSGCNNF
jgi:hypothetical protein